MAQKNSACSNILNQIDGSLHLLVERPPQHDTCCHTVHIVLACGSATDYSPRSPYTPERVWLCGHPIAPSAGTKRCTQHWFSLFVCYASDLQPVAMANTTQQLAELLGAPAVFLLDAKTRQSLDVNGWMQNNPTAAPVTLPTSAAASTTMQASQAVALLHQQSQAADMEVEPPPPAAYYEGDRLILEVPEPQGSWTTTACAALFIVLCVDSIETFQEGHRYTIMQICRCGNESGKQLYCGQHRKAAHVYLLAKTGDLVWAGSTLSDLAPVLAVSDVIVRDPPGDSQAKLATETKVADSSAAPAACDDGGCDSKQQQEAPAAASQGPKAAAGAPSIARTILRLHFTPEQIAAAERQPSSAGLSRLQQGYVDVQLSDGTACCAETPCLGLNLQLGVSSLQQLASSCGPVLVAAGCRCGNNGGTKRCCKQHRSTLFVLTDQQGNLLPGAANFDGLASILKVFDVQLLDSSTLQPLQEYQQLPPSIRWQVSSDGTSFRVWMPPDHMQKVQTAAAQKAPHQQEQMAPEQQPPPQQQQQTVAGPGRQCIGLEFMVALQQGQAHAMGSSLPVLSVTRCGNLGRSPSSACRHHQQGVLHLVAQGAGGQTVLTACRSLGELAIWLGVQQVEILDSQTGKPIDFYQALVPAPLQLAMPIQIQQHQQQLSSLAPPSLQVEAPQGWNGSAAAGDDALTASTAAATSAKMVDEQPHSVVQVPSALSGASVAAGQGNCSIELLPHAADANSSSAQVQGYVIGVPSRPVGAAKSNPCRALNVLVFMGCGQVTQIPGQRRCSLSHVQRCGNEAGNKSRCKQHNDAPVQVLALSPSDLQQQAARAEAGPLSGAHPLQQQVPALVAKLNSNAELAEQLGVSTLLFKCRDTGEDLGDISNWSPSKATGAAAKVQQQVTAAAPQAPVAVTVALPPLLQATLGKAVAVLPSAMQALAQQQQQQQREVEAKSVGITDTTADAAEIASSLGASHLSLHQCGGLKSDVGSSSRSIVQGVGSFGLLTPLTPITGFHVQQTAQRGNAPLVLQSSALATSIAAGDGCTPTESYRLLERGAGFSSSAPPLAKLASMFK